MKPIVAIICSEEIIEIDGWGTLKHQAVFEKYIVAVRKYMNCVPVLVPSMSKNIRDAEDIASNITFHCHGILLTGGQSNVSTSFYKPKQKHIGSKDLERDRLALALVKKAISTQTPLFGICRGMHEINIAFSGTLISEIHAISNKRDHRSDKSLKFEARYNNSHIISFPPNSIFHSFKMLENINSISVNSLHSQGIKKLGTNLQIDAISDDDVVEAISYPAEKTKIFGVQWHPEWYIEDNSINLSLWNYFSGLCYDNLNKTE